MGSVFHTGKEKDDKMKTGMIQTLAKSWMQIFMIHSYGLITKLPHNRTCAENSPLYMLFVSEYLQAIHGDLY